MPTKYFKKTEKYQERFYQLPKVFFTNKKFTKISLEAKVAYSILRDRLELSIKNNWVDDEDNIYLIYTNENLMSILNLGKNKVVKIKKELENAHLLKQKRVGLNKPNKLYLLKPEVTKQDICQIQKEESGEKSSNNKEVYESNFQSSDIQTFGSLQNKLPKVCETNTSDTDISDTDISDTDISDMNDMNDTNNIKSTSDWGSHSNHSNHKSQTFDIVSEQEEIQYELQEFPEHLAQYITNYTLPEVRIIKSVLLKAKRSFHDERAHEISHPYSLEDIEQELINVLKRFRFMLKKKDETVESMQSYLMRCVKSEFEELHAWHMRRQHMPKDNIFNL
ncbi:replication initiator protein A [Staphylococcus caprae]|uniref:replication initiator protein A n=1 Tax=Staphylococcus caprae TaxID=29380 RepID=UPI000CD12902|nr:replication initiator protein A [Staphylococcus caprae]POA06095.1 replication protein [Staphylococcus caprae]